MIGLPKSPSFMPVARHRARAPAMLRPWVEVRERYWGMTELQTTSRAAPTMGGIPNLAQIGPNPPMLVHPQFDLVAISIGPLSVHWYGLMYLLAFLQFQGSASGASTAAWRRLDA